MKKLYTGILFMLCSISTYAQTGFLRIETEPSNAQLYIDGEYKGNTPQNLTLSIGRHIVEIRNANYETQSFPISIVENEVTRQIIILQEVSGFRIKQEQSNTVSQAKGKLTIITSPDESSISIDDVPVEEKTPITIEEIGAGDHVVTVTNWIEHNKQYEEVSINKTVHIQPNKTLLLNIDFTENLGHLNVQSVPEATVFIDDLNYGRTPLNITNLNTGGHNIRLSARLSGEFPVDEYSISDNFNIEAQNTTDLNFDFYNYFKLGEFHIRSNLLEQPVQLSNATFNKSLDLTTGMDTKILVGDYSMRWSNNNDIETIDFKITEDKKTVVFIPLKRELISDKNLSDHPEYISYEDFISNINFLPEEEIRKTLGYSIRRGYYQSDDPFHTVTKYFGWGMTFFGSWIIGGLAGSNEVALAAGGIGVLALLIVPFYSYNKTIELPNNKVHNNSLREDADIRYNNMRDQWNTWSETENQRIALENEKIIESNNNLPQESVVYE